MNLLLQGYMHLLMLKKLPAGEEVFKRLRHVQNISFKSHKSVNLIVLKLSHVKQQTTVLHYMFSRKIHIIEDGKKSLLAKTQE